MDEGFEVRIEQVDDLVGEDAALVETIAAMPAWRKAKCEALTRGEDRRRSIAVWLLLKKMLAERAIDAAALEVVENEFGKPVFRNRPRLHFSLSHSGSRVMVALAERLVGCDIEKRLPLDEGVFSEALSPSELRFVRAKPTEDERTDVFYRLWTRKESYVKATGKGLAAGLTTFSVLPDEAPKGARFKDYSVSDGYFASVCIV